MKSGQLLSLRSIAEAIVVSAVAAGFFTWAITNRMDANPFIVFSIMFVFSVLCWAAGLWAIHLERKRRGE